MGNTPHALRTRKSLHPSRSSKTRRSTFGSDSDSQSPVPKTFAVPSEFTSTNRRMSIIDIPLPTRRRHGGTLRRPPPSRGAVPLCPRTSPKIYLHFALAYTGHSAGCGMRGPDQDCQRPRTWCPRSTKASTRCDPIKTRPACHQHFRHVLALRVFTYQLARPN